MLRRKRWRGSATLRPSKLTARLSICGKCFCRPWAQNSRRNKPTGSPMTLGAVRIALDAIRAEVLFLDSPLRNNRQPNVGYTCGGMVDLVLGSHPLCLVIVVPA